MKNIFKKLNEERSFSIITPTSYANNPEKNTLY